ncbi:MAG: DUF4197 family protein [Sphaerochaeta sp.]|jgi:hypothetical protein|uniref:DUF4197 family protein n=1 Tax=Sphaerochaeta sp. TaxID=1972642 RepID=UPI002FC94F91
MKRLPILALLPVCLLLIGCTTTQRQQQPAALTSEQALTEVVKLASESVDANLFAPLTLEELLPPQAQLFVDLEEIPLFSDQLSLWNDQVLLAYRQVVLQIPALVQDAVGKVTWQQPDQLVKGGNQSATTYFLEDQGKFLSQGIRIMLTDALKQSQITWDLILKRYAIWREATMLWGRAPLPEITVSVDEHLFDLCIATYYAELGVQEAQARTTPVPKGSGSFLELFQQDVQP